MSASGLIPLRAAWQPVPPRDQLRRRHELGRTPAPRGEDRAHCWIPQGLLPVCTAGPQGLRPQRGSSRSCTCVFSCVTRGRSVPTPTYDAPRQRLASDSLLLRVRPPRRRGLLTRHPYSCGPAFLRRPPSLRSQSSISNSPMPITVWLLYPDPALTDTVFS